MKLIGHFIGIHSIHITPQIPARCFQCADLFLNTMAIVPGRVIWTANDKEHNDAADLIDFPDRIDTHVDPMEKQATAYGTAVFKAMRGDEQIPELHVDDTVLFSPELARPMFETMPGEHCPEFC